MEGLRKLYLDYGFLVMGVFFLWLVGLSVWLVIGNREVEIKPIERTEQEDIIVEESCDESCVQALIAEAVASLQGGVGLTPTPTIKPGEAKKPAASHEESVALSGGESSSSDWVSVGVGTYIDTALYGELVSATWSGVAEIIGGSGAGRIRLYDATNSRMVDGSELMVKDTEKISFYSGNLSIWRGQNQYFIQIKSETGSQIKVSNAVMKLVVR